MEAATPKAPVPPAVPMANAERGSTIDAHQIDFTVRTNAYLLDYIKFGDTKAGALLALAGLVGGGIASTVPKVVPEALALGLLSALGVVMLVVGILVCAIGVGLFCLRALQPTTPTAASLTSFPDISGMTLEQYAQGVSKLSARDGIVAEYCKHNWTLAHIANTKFASIRTATRFLRWMLLLGTIYGSGAVAIAIFHQQS